MKKYFRKIWLPRLRKTAKGAISLFMVVLMLPFHVIAMLLVEVQRYNSAVSVLDESMGVSAVSTLAGYDDYVKSRWGLMSTGQQKDLNDVFSGYLKTNTSVMGKTLNVNSTSVNGMYPLTEPDVLGKQVVEFSKYKVTTKTALDTLQLNKLIGELEKIGNASTYIKGLTNFSKTVDSATSLIDSMDELKKASDDLKTKITDYETKYNELQTAVTDLAAKLGETPPTDADALNAYNADVTEKTTTVETKKSAYQSSISDLTSQLSSYEKSMEKLEDALKSLDSNIRSTAAGIADIAVLKSKAQRDLDSTKEKIKAIDDAHKNDEPTSLEVDYEEDGQVTDHYEFPTDYTQDRDYQNLIEQRNQQEAELNQLKMRESIDKAGNSGIDTMYNSANNTLKSYSRDRVRQEIETLNAISESLNSLDITKDTNVDEFKTGYFVTINSYIPSDLIEQFIKEQDEMISSGGLAEFLSGIEGLYNALFKFATLYEPALCGVLDTHYYESMGGLPGKSDGGMIGVIRSIGKTIQSVYDLKNSVKEKSIRKFLKAAKGIAEGVTSTVTGIIEVQTTMFENLHDLFTSDLLCHQLYCYNMLPCRTNLSTNHVSYTSLAGGVADLPYSNISSSGIGVYDDLLALIRTFSTLERGSGSDKCFYGAEMEYLIFGSNSELANQAFVFFATYLTRLLIDIPAIVTNAEVTEIADTIGAVTLGIGAAVVYLVEIFVEPLIDTLVLVNGGEVQLYEQTIFLTPSGFVDLISTFVTCAKLTSAQKAELQETARVQVNEAFNANLTADTMKKQKSSPWMPRINYQTQCLILMMLTVRDEDLIGRLMNLIQTETHAHYLNSTTPISFDLHNSYTFLETEADVKVAQLLPSMTDQSIFDVKRTIYRGY